jgi:hypothetical protein
MPERLVGRSQSFDNAPERGSFAATRARPAPCDPRQLRHCSKRPPVAIGAGNADQSKRPAHCGSEVTQQPTGPPRGMNWQGWHGLRNQRLAQRYPARERLCHNPGVSTTHPRDPQCNARATGSAENEAMSCSHHAKRMLPSTMSRPGISKPQDDYHAAGTSRQRISLVVNGGASGRTGSVIDTESEVDAARVRSRKDGHLVREVASSDESTTIHTMPPRTRVCNRPVATRGREE